MVSTWRRQRTGVADENAETVFDGTVRSPARMENVEDIIMAFNEKGVQLTVKPCLA